jgi:hypothetical protein
MVMNRIGPVGAKSVAAMVAVTGGLTSIDLSGNQLCGIWTDDDGIQRGTYTAEGITAIADALGVNGAMAEIRYGCLKLERFVGLYHPFVHVDCLCTSNAPSLLCEAALCCCRSCVMQRSGGALPLCVPAHCMCGKGVLLPRI